MANLPEHFDELLSRIEPKSERAKAAQDIPAQVRSFLKDSEKIKTVDPYSRLAGSYARCTAIKDIKDVDVILFVTPEYKDEEPEIVLNALFSALQNLTEGIDDKGEVTICRHQRRSVNVHLEKKDFDLDIVPVVALDGADKKLEIPDKDWSKWVSTHPLGYADALSKLNATHKGKVVPLVKMLKHWRDVHMVYKRPKSYWLECLVYHKIDDGDLVSDNISYAEMFRDLMSSIEDSFQKYLDEKTTVPKIPDPMLGNNVAHNWERGDFEAFMNQVHESKRWAERALQQDDDSKAVELWQKVFGVEWFPAVVAQKIGESLRAANLAGSIFVTPNGKVQIEKPTGRNVQVPSQRFYGK